MPLPLTTVIPRLTMFAGPNGSGKSTFKKETPASDLGIYLNPDELEQQLRLEGIFRFDHWQLDDSDPAEYMHFISQHSLAGKVPNLSNLYFTHDCLYLNDSAETNSYLASILIDYLRQHYLLAKRSFSFETVMSHPGKIAVMQQATAAGFIVHFKFVTTRNPLINLDRVHMRVKQGGHPVDEQKIIERYHRTHQLLPQALVAADYAQVFDNSARQPILLLEKTPKKGFITHSPNEGFPKWFVHDVMQPLQLV